MLADIVWPTYSDSRVVNMIGVTVGQRCNCGHDFGLHLLDVQGPG